ncbi:hypothetical protein Q4E93_20685 [Flavitalea sp. BT771]|uniref:hypothetical protein n=1 Tax=Flavitalea sp. BT771 TaxID=3063329 RepID=UPI0026E31840|nr:hypothetical protein [Flavitalea sp. BT771]MDO6433037.1 hypothetical protein [Flavitalea sp. BT771]MDV6221687.1 hypothetical protein [Flavitalea sp. BT771]
MKPNPNYDAALTFAGEQRFLARGIARQLSPLGYSIFYDENGDTFGKILIDPAYFRGLFQVCIGLYIRDDWQKPAGSTTFSSVFVD